MRQIMKTEIWNLIKYASSKNYLAITSNNLLLAMGFFEYKQYFNGWKRRVLSLLNLHTFKSISPIFLLFVRKPAATTNQKIRAKLKVLMLSSFMYWFVIFLVFCNSVFSFMQHYNQPQWITDTLCKSTFS